MKKARFKLYYLVNTLIAGKYDVCFYTIDGDFICKQFDEVYEQKKYDLYEKNVYCIVVKDDVIEVTFTREN